MVSLETQLNEALAEIASLKLTLHRERVARATEERAKMLREAMLTIESTARINRAFAQSIDNVGLKEAINAERRHVRNMSKQDLRVERILG